MARPHIFQPSRNAPFTSLHCIQKLTMRGMGLKVSIVMVSRIACTLCMRRDDHVDIRHIRPGEKLICQEPEKCPVWARKMLVFGTLEKITLALPSITHLYQCATSACTPTCTCRKCRHLNFGGQGQTCSKAFQPNVSITNTCCMYSVYTSSP